MAVVGNDSDALVARRLRLLVESDRELSRFVDSAGQDEQTASPRPRLLSFVGTMHSGRGDLSDRHAEIIREGLKRPD